eukprot:EG_transcript_4293
MGSQNKRISVKVSHLPQEALPGLVVGAQVDVSLGDGNEDVTVAIDLPMLSPGRSPDSPSHRAQDGRSQSVPSVTSVNEVDASTPPKGSPCAPSSADVKEMSTAPKSSAAPPPAPPAPTIPTTLLPSPADVVRATQSERTYFFPAGNFQPDHSSENLADGLLEESDDDAPPRSPSVRGSSPSSPSSRPRRGSSSMEDGPDDDPASPSLWPTPSPSAPFPDWEEATSSSAPRPAFPHRGPRPSPPSPGELMAVYLPEDRADHLADRVAELVARVPRSSLIPFKDADVPLGLRGWVAQLHRRERLAEWRDLLQLAVRSQDFGGAAMLRDRIRAFVDDDPAALEGRLEAAVQRSDFADAARVRDRLKKQQLQRWARPVAAIRPGTVILRISQGRLAAPRSLRRTPVLILTHDSRGTLGVCLNNLLGPISLCKADSFTQELEELKKAGHAESGLFDGGLGSTKPVLTVLHQQSIPEAPQLDLSNDLFSLFANVKRAGEQEMSVQRAVKLLKCGRMCPEQVRVFTGQMRWPPRSLEAQLNDGLWLPCLLSPSLMFSQRKPEVVWNEVWALLREWCRQHTLTVDTYPSTEEPETDPDL